MGNQHGVRLILASGSPARRELLTRAGYTFDVIPANIDEPTEADAHGIRDHVHSIAWRKAAAVAGRVADGVIIAADTVGWLHNHVIGKPADAADARRILRTLGGTTHELWTGCVLWRKPDDVQICWQEVSEVQFRALSDAELDAYLATRQWEGCSGAYAIQEKDDPYVRVVRGSMSNVIGLPMETLARLLPNLQR
ncbi:maf protein [Planctomycetaceae bacterium SCGC AG-212-F19]|nr:maf protein [Planctomycetaceae bacterium SCGC AG-212-F19]